MFGPEAQVMFAICAFYAYDACVPLAADAGLMRCSGRTGWHGLLATQGFEVRWAYLVWPALLLPHQPVYPLRWQASRIHLPGDPAVVQGLQAHAASLRRFAVPLYGLGCALFVLLPGALFVWPGEAGQLVAAALVYLFAGWIAMQVWRHGRTGHTPRSVARAIAVQCLLCPPFALNAVRKLSAAYTPAIDLLQAAHPLLQPAAWDALARRMEAVIEAEMDAAQADGHARQAQQLHTALQKLQALAPHAAGTPAP